MNLTSDKHIKQYKSKNYCHSLFLLNYFIISFLVKKLN